MANENSRAPDSASAATNAPFLRPSPPAANDSPMGKIPLETPNPFKHVSNMAEMRTLQPLSEAATSFKFDSPIQGSTPTTPEIKGFPFLLAGGSKSTVGSLSLKSWSREDSSYKSFSGEKENRESISAESIALTPPPKPAPPPTTRWKAMSDSLMSWPWRRSVDTDRTESDDAPLRRSRFADWRLRHRNKVQNERFAAKKEPIGEFWQLLRMARGRSTEHVPGMADGLFAEHSTSASTPRTRTGESPPLCRSMPDLDLTPSQVAGRHVPRNSAGDDRRFPSSPRPVSFQNLVADWRRSSRQARVYHEPNSRTLPLG